MRTAAEPLSDVEIVEIQAHVPIAHVRLRHDATLRLSPERYVREQRQSLFYIVGKEKR
jgi:hypothetical protein